MPVLSAHLPEAVVQAVAEMVNRGLATDGIACLLLGTMSPEGEWTSWGMQSVAEGE